MFFGLIGSYYWGNLHKVALVVRYQGTKRKQTSRVEVEINRKKDLRTNNLFPLPGIMFHYMKIIIGLVFLQISPAISNFKASTTSVQADRSSKEPACHGKDAGKFVKDPYNCDKFYYCASDESAIVVDCPHGMIFNDEKEICDFPTNYLCVPRIEEEEEGVASASANPQTTTSTQKENEESSSTSSSELQVTPSTVSTTITTTTTTIVAVEQSCPQHDTKTLIFLQHPHDCHRYYICYHGVPVDQECISELHWNPQTNRCDFPENSGCFVPTVVPSPTTVSVATIISCPFRGEQIYPHPVNCNYFIYCINGYSTVQQCPFYHHFDVRSRRCLWQTVATCMTNVDKKIEYK